MSLGIVADDVVEHGPHGAARVDWTSSGVSALATLSHGPSWAVDSVGMSAPRFGARITPYEQLTCVAETRRPLLLAIVHSSYTALYTEFEKVSRLLDYFIHN